MLIRENKDHLVLLYIWMIRILCRSAKSSINCIFSLSSYFAIYIFYLGSLLSGLKLMKVFFLIILSNNMG